MASSSASSSVALTSRPPAEASVLEGILMAFCNPLLDISTTVDEAFLNKYSLQANNAILAEVAHLPLYEELTNSYNVNYTAGGSAQNTMRAAQWLLPPGSTVYVGCVGRDAYGTKLREVATGEGLLVAYQEDETGTATGTCACLITANGQCRSLVANLGAANNFHPRHLETSPMPELLERARFYYISGFFLTVSPDAIMNVAQRAVTEEKVLCFNLSAPFICSYFQEPLMRVLPYVDFLFGNEAEALALSKQLKLATEETEQIATELARLPSVKGQSRTVIITQGAQPTIVATPGTIQHFSVHALAPEKIVDTNGAGDAFVGGFLSQLVQGKELATCVAAGHYVASVIIQRSGITFPPRPDKLLF